LRAIQRHFGHTSNLPNKPYLLVSLPRCAPKLGLVAATTRNVIEAAWRQLDGQLNLSARSSTENGCFEPIVFARGRWKGTNMSDQESDRLSRENDYLKRRCAQLQANNDDLEAQVLR